MTNQSEEDSVTKTIIGRRDICVFEGLEIRRLLSAGQLDTTFGTGGVVITDRGLSFSEGVIAQGDGKIVMVADKQGGGATLARYNADGSPDATFGNGGVANWTIGTAAAISSMDVTDAAGSVRVAPDGRLLMLGVVELANGAARQSVSRFNSDGTPDASFGNHGTVALNWPTKLAPAPGGATLMEVSPSLLQFQSDGSILIARTTGSDLGADVQVVRLTAGGQIDANFGNYGIATAARAGVPVGMSLQADGKIVVATREYGLLAGLSKYGPRPVHANLVRFNADGSLDASFGVGGRVSESLPDGRQIYADQLLIAADGKLVLLGTETLPDDSGRTENVVIRYNANGSRDGSFGSGGKQILLNGTEAIAIDGQGRIVSTGTGATANGYGANVLFSQRLNADGSLDTSYGDQGTTKLSLATRSFSAEAITLAADGDIVIAGYTSTSFSQTAETADVLLVRLKGDDATAAAAGVKRSVTSKNKKSAKHKRQEAEAAAAAAAATPSGKHHRHTKSVKHIRQEAEAAAAALTAAPAGTHHKKSVKHIRQEREAAAKLFNAASEIAVA